MNVYENYISLLELILFIALSTKFEQNYSVLYDFCNKLTCRF